MKKKLLVVTGEISGELHATGLLTELRKLSPRLEFYGTGGARLEKIGMRLLHSIDDMATIGMSELFSKYRYLKRVMADVIASLDTENPVLAILVDYGGFNLRLLPRIKKRGIPVVYYISPQVWASRRRRINIIKKYADALIVILPFEKKFYERFHMDAQYFGHPLVEHIRKSMNREQVARKYNLDSSKTWFSFLMGSRPGEIARHQAIAEQAALLIAQDKKQAEFLNCAISGSSLNRAETGSMLKTIENDMYNVAGNSDFAIVCSGTAALEVALLRTPMLIFYRPDPFLGFLARYIFKVTVIGIPNIIVGQTYIPELIAGTAFRDTSEKNLSRQIAVTALRSLKDKTWNEEFLRQCQRLKSELSGNNAYAGGAKYIYDRFIR